jgi:hypothetical protein
VDAENAPRRAREEEHLLHQEGGRRGRLGAYPNTHNTTWVRAVDVRVIGRPSTAHLPHLAAACAVFASPGRRRGAAAPSPRGRSEKASTAKKVPGCSFAGTCGACGSFCNRNVGI